MTSPEINLVGRSYPVLEELIERGADIDIYQLALSGLAKLKAAGQSGTLTYERPVTLQMKKVAVLDDYREIPAHIRMPGHFDDPEIITEKETKAPSRTYDPDYQPKQEIITRAIPAEDFRQVLAAQRGDQSALNALMTRYKYFVRLKASAYFLPGGEGEDLMQEGMLGLHKAIRDYKPAEGASFRTFAELCITRQIITAVKTATRNKHIALNEYVSFESTPPGHDPDSDLTLGNTLSSPENGLTDVIATSKEELNSLVGMLKQDLSQLESDALRLFLSDYSYEEMSKELECDPKTIDNALQRVKRKIHSYQSLRG